MAPHDIQLPICVGKFHDNDSVHEALWRKHDELVKEVSSDKYERVKEMTALQTRVLIYSTIGATLGSAVMLGIIGTGFWILQNYVLKR